MVLQKGLAEVLQWHGTAENTLASKARELGLLQSHAPNPSPQIRLPISMKVIHVSAESPLNWQTDVCPRDGLCNQLLVNLRGEGVRRASIWDILIFSISRLSRQEAKSVCWWAGMNYETTHVGWEVARSWGSVATSVSASGLGEGSLPGQEGRSGVYRWVITVRVWPAHNGTSKGFPKPGP